MALEVVLPQGRTMGIRASGRLLLLSIVTLMSAVTAYGRGAYAACVNSGGSAYTCSGANVTTQTINANSAAVSTVPGFSVDTTGTNTNAVSITGAGALSYSDISASPLNAGRTALSIQSTGNDGITPGTITVNTNGALTGSNSGIQAINSGSGALSITAYGNVTGTSGFGVSAQNNGTGLTVTTGETASVTGNQIGIFATSSGSGPLTIVANGDVTGRQMAGINAHAGGGSIGITIGLASNVTSNGTGSSSFAIQTSGGPSSATIAGTLNGGAAGAIQFDQSAALNDRLELQPGAVVNGKVLAGPGTDTLVLGGEGEASFDVGAIGAGLQYQSFETFLKEDESHWILTGSNTSITDWAVTGGVLSVDATMPNTLFTVNNATLGGSGIIGGFIGTGGLMVAPGNSIGTLTSHGNVVFGPSSTFEVEANAAGQADKLVVNGTVNLTGSVLRVLAEAGSYKPKTEYVIIDNDGGDAVIGKFAQITASLAFLTPVVIYDGGDGNDVVLTLLTKCPTPPTPPNPPKPSPLATFCSAAKTHNQRAVAKALSLFPAENPLFLAVLNQASPEEARQAFDALSGEVHATMSGVLADESRYVREAVLGRLIQASYTNNAGQIASSAPGGRWSPLSIHKP